MKKLFTLALILTIFSYLGCKKDLPYDPNIDLEGTWELRASVGGQAAGVPSEVAPGNGNLMKFTGKNYEKMADGKLVKAGTYTLIREISWTATETRIVFDNDMKTKYFVEILKGRLILYSYGPISADGTKEDYEKI